jgi:MFS transporter, FHS family, glucose/mannose:H+ symporter
MSQIKAESTRKFLIFLHIAFFLSGIATVLIGQILPIIGSKFALNDQQLGYLFPAQFIGSIAGTLLTNWFGKRNNFLLATLIGSFSMACGIIALNSGNFEICIAGFVVNGIGVGMTLPSINMLILELRSDNPTAALNFLNVFWGLGAILSQPFVSFLGKNNSLVIPTSLLAGLLGIIGILIAILPREKTIHLTDAKAIIVTNLPPIWTTPMAWGIALFNFIHVGLESGIGGWLTTYTQRISGGATDFIQPIILFYLFFVAGRLFAPVLTKFFDENKMLFIGLNGLMIGLFFMLFANGIPVLSIGAMVAGFGTSFVFPTNLARFNKTFGESSVRRTTPFFICGTLGATSMNWMIGFVSNRYNNDLSKGMLVMVASIFALIALQIVLSRRKLTS